MTARRRGFALLIVLWTLVPVSILFLTLSGVARSDSHLTFNLRNAAKLQAAADGGIITAIFGLLRAPDTIAPIRLKVGEATVSVDITSLGGRVNPNTANADLLRALLQRGGADPAQATRIALAIVEWRTPGPTPQLVLARAAPYRSAGLDYGPPSAQFEAVDEVREVIGMTAPLFETLRPNLTLFTDRPPDPGTASPMVRAALADLGIGGGPPQSGNVFRISAEALAADGSSAVRAATIRIGPNPNGRPWKVLAWESAE